MFTRFYSCLQGCTALHKAAGISDTAADEIVKLLLSKGAHVNATDKHVSDNIHIIGDGHWHLLSALPVHMTCSCSNSSKLYSKLSHTTPMCTSS